MPVYFDPRRPNEKSPQKRTLVLLVIIAGLMFAIGVVIVIGRLV